MLIITLKYVLILGSFEIDKIYVFVDVSLSYFN